MDEPQSLQKRATGRWSQPFFSSKGGDGRRKSVATRMWRIRDLLPFAHCGLSASTLFQSSVEDFSLFHIQVNQTEPKINIGESIS